LSCAGVWTEPGTGLPLETSVTQSRVSYLSGCRRNTIPFLEKSHSRFDELEPLGGVFYSFWICECEIGYELALLIPRNGHVTFGRGDAQEVPSLSEDLSFDLVFSSLGIEGMAPRGHRVDQNEIGRWSWRTDGADVFEDAEACHSYISNTASARSAKHKMLLQG